MCGVLFLMRKKRIFFQDFLFEGMPVDEQDYPTIEIRYLSGDDDIHHDMIVSFDAMLKMDKLEEWKALFEQTENKNVCIKDDVVMKNSEMDIYHDFYLKTYAYNISKHCKNVYVLQE